MKILQSVAFYGIIAGVALNFAEAEKFAAWTFDRRNGTTIIPEYPPSRNFYGDASVLGTNTSSIFPPGKEGSCVFVDGEELLLAKNLSRTCILDLDLCESGLTLTFYLKIVSWNNASLPAILRTTSENNTSAGLYLGKSKDDKLILNMTGSSGIKTTQKSSLPLNRWVRYHYVLHGQFGHSRFDGHKKEPTTDVVQESATNFVLSSKNGPSFYLDELSVYYATSVEQNSVPITTLAAESHRSITTVVYEVDDASSAPHTTASVISNDQSNIWIPIVIGAAAFTTTIFCIVLLMLYRRKRTSRRMTDRGDYVRASTIEPDPCQELNPIAEVPDDERV